MVDGAGCGQADAGVPGHAPADAQGQGRDAFETAAADVVQRDRGQAHAHVDPAEGDPGLAANDADALAKAAHRFKSGSANLGALKLADYCRELESLGRGGSTSGAEELVTQIDQEYGRVAMALQDELETAAQ